MEGVDKALKEITDCKSLSIQMKAFESQYDDSLLDKLFKPFLTLSNLTDLDIQLDGYDYFNRK